MSLSSSFSSRVVIGLIVAPLVWLSGVAQAQILNPANGHYYEIVNSLDTWDQARVSAASMTFSGAQGHLVTIADVAENTFVAGLTSNDVWIGLTDSTATSTIDAFDLSTLGTAEHGLAQFSNPYPTSGNTPDDEAGLQRGEGWQWVTGERLEFQNWSTGTNGEPNDGLAGPKEDGAYLISSANGAWNDFPAGSTIGQNDVTRAYVVEYEPMPEPSTFVLSVLGLLSLGMIGRRRRRR